MLSLACLLAMRAAVDSPDDIVCLALAHRVLLAAAASTIVVTLPVVVIVAMWEATAFWFFLIRQTLHHIA
jgi:hypothetical protein